MHGVIACWAWFRSRRGVPAWFRADVVRSCGQQVSVGRQRAQPAVPADRCAREILRILTGFAVRLRRLNGIPFGGSLVPPIPDEMP